MENEHGFVRVCVKDRGKALHVDFLATGRVKPSDQFVICRDQPCNSVPLFACLDDQLSPGNVFNALLWCCPAKMCLEQVKMEPIAVGVVFRAIRRLWTTSALRPRLSCSLSNKRRLWSMLPQRIFERNHIFSNSNKTKKSKTKSVTGGESSIEKQIKERMPALIVFDNKDTHKGSVPGVISKPQRRRLLSRCGRRMCSPVGLRIIIALVIYAGLLGAVAVAVANGLIGKIADVATRWGIAGHVLVRRLRRLVCFCRSAF